MCDAAFDIILLWSVTKKTKGAARKIKSLHSYKDDAVPRTSNPLVTKDKKNPGNQLPEGRRQLVTAVDGWYLLSTPDFVVVFFSCSWTQYVASHRLQLWLCAVLAVEHAARIV